MKSVNGATFALIMYGKRTKILRKISLFGPVLGINVNLISFGCKFLHKRIS